MLWFYKVRAAIFNPWTHASLIVLNEHRITKDKQKDKIKYTFFPTHAVSNLLLELVNVAVGFMACTQRSKL